MLFREMMHDQARQDAARERDATQAQQAAQLANQFNQQDAQSAIAGRQRLEGLAREYGQTYADEARPLADSSLEFFSNIAGEQEAQRRAAARAQAEAEAARFEAEDATKRYGMDRDYEASIYGADQRLTGNLLDYDLGRDELDWRDDALTRRLESAEDIARTNRSAAIDAAKAGASGVDIGDLIRGAEVVRKTRSQGIRPEIQGLGEDEIMNAILNEVLRNLGVEGSSSRMVGTEENPIEVPPGPNAARRTRSSAPMFDPPPGYDKNK
jgi:hypothetical protein